MNYNQKVIINKFTAESDKLFHDEIATDENKDYRRGYYAGRLHAAIALSKALKDNEGQDIIKVEFE